MFKNARGKFDGRLFIGLMMGLGSVGGVALKLWWSIGDNIPTFWLLAVLIVSAAVGLSIWVERRREHRRYQDRLDRATRLERPPPRREPDEPRL